MTRTPILVSLVLLAAIPPLLGEERPRREVQDTLGISVNNLGLQNGLSVSWGWPLPRSDAALRRDAHVSVGLSHTISPSYTRVGASFDLVPLSVLGIHGGVEPAFYFGSFHSLTSFDSASDAFDRDALEARSDHASAGAAARAYLGPTIQLRVGHLAAQSSANLEWWWSNAPGPYFYEPARDTLLRAAGDRLLTTTSVLLLERPGRSGHRLSGGLIHQFSEVLDTPLNRTQSLGLMMVREDGGRHLGLNRPRLLGHLSYYLTDRSKKGQLCATLALSVALGRPPAPR
jgi:hypothetical protein